MANAPDFFPNAPTGTWLFAELPASTPGSILYTSDEGWCECGNDGVTWTPAQFSGPAPGSINAEMLSPALNATLALVTNALQPASAGDSISYSNGIISLSGDVANPGNSELYGTNGSGVKGWYAQPSGGGTAPVTTKGDLLGFNTAAARLPVGTDGTVLTADSTNALGVSYKAPTNAGFISGIVTSTTVIATYPPASYGGSSILTSDMGLMSCDSVRWNVVGTPPIPPGAAVLGYTKNVYTVFPVLADISYTYSTKSRLYSGYGPGGRTPTSSAYTTAANGQLQLIFPSGGGANAAQLTTETMQNSQLPAANLGTLPYLLAGTGFYIEAAYTIPGTNDTDNFNAFFALPQQHNTTQNDHNTTYPTGYEQWHEFDVNENGHGTDRSGTFRGAYLQWAGKYNWAWTLSAAPASGATSFSLASAWTGESASFPVTFSNGNTRTVALTNGSTGPYSMTALSASATTAVTISWNTLINNSNTQTAALDYTVEHIFGAAYDPIGQTYTVWLDGAQQSQVSTTGSGSSNAFRDTGLIFLLFQTASHGSNNASVMNLRYFSAWTP